MQSTQESKSSENLMEKMMNANSIDEAKQI